jgi:hypothetical protein
VIAGFLALAEGPGGETSLEHSLSVFEAYEVQGTSIVSKRDFRMSSALTFSASAS